MFVAGIVVWLALAILTVGPIFSTHARGERGWIWIVAAFVLGPLAGVGYYLARYGERAAQRRRVCRSPATLGRMSGCFCRLGLRNKRRQRSCCSATSSRL
jgi:hypothetical protein